MILHNQSDVSEYQYVASYVHIMHYKFMYVRICILGEMLFSKEDPSTKGNQLYYCAGVATPLIVTFFLIE